MAKDHFEQLNRWLDIRLRGSDCAPDIYYIADKITWCYKWRKITDAQKDILCDKVVQLLN
jgi:hypothetical protein